MGHEIYLDADSVQAWQVEGGHSIFPPGFFDRDGLFSMTEGESCRFIFSGAYSFPSGHNDLITGRELVPAGAAVVYDIKLVHISTLKKRDIERLDCLRQAQKVGSVDYILSRDEINESVEDLRGEGNLCYGRQEFAQARKFYTQAISMLYLYDKSHTMDIDAAKLYCNLAQTYYKMDEIEKCVEVCRKVSQTTSTATDPGLMLKLAKALYLEAQCQISRAERGGDLKLAQSNLQQALELSPRDTAIRAAWNTLRSKVKSNSKKGKNNLGKIENLFSADLLQSHTQQPRECSYPSGIFNQSEKDETWIYEQDD